MTRIPMDRDRSPSTGTGSTAQTPEPPVAHAEAERPQGEGAGQDKDPEPQGEADGPNGAPQGDPEPRGAQEPPSGESASPQDTGEEVETGQEEPGEDAEQVRIRELEQELDAVKARWLRSRADYDNLVRRTERERQETRKTAAARLISEILPQVEVLDRAAREISEVDEGHAKGIRMAVHSLKTALEKEGLVEVPGEGAPFDPKHHEAVMREASDAPEGTVTQVVQPGYMLHDKLLKAALVKVSAGASGEGETEQASSEASKSPT